jgi:hypothetical protein
VAAVAVAGLERVLRLCEDSGLPQCGRLRELAEAAGRLPEDLYLQALAGLLGEVEEEARRRGIGELAEAAAEARRDAEWALEGSGW